MSFSDFQRVHFVKTRQGGPQESPLYECKLNEITIGQIWTWTTNKGVLNWQSVITLPPQPGESYPDQLIRQHRTFEHAECWSVEFIQKFLETDNRASVFLVDVPDEDDE